MEWLDVADPNNEFDLNLEWGRVKSEYLPEEIQEMINERGVQHMVREVNSHFSQLKMRKPLVLKQINNKKAVIEQ